MFSLRIKYDGFPPSKRGFNNAVKDVLTETAYEWHRRFFEQHFTPAGGEKYGYFKRKGENLRGTKRFNRSYVGRKERMFGHDRPLVFTGEAYRESKIPKVTATNKMSKVILSRKFNFKHPKSRIVMREEVTRVLPDEREQLIRFADERLNEKLQKLRD